MRQRSEDIAEEVEQLKHKIEELEKLARGQGLSGILTFRRHNTEDEKKG